MGVADNDIGALGRNESDGLAGDAAGDVYVCRDAENLCHGRNGSAVISLGCGVKRNGVLSSSLTDIIERGVCRQAELRRYSAICPPRCTEDLKSREAQP